MAQLQRELDTLRKQPKSGGSSSSPVDEGNFDRSGKRHAQVEEAKPSNVQLVKTEKSVETAALLRNALKECDLLRRLEGHHIDGFLNHSESKKSNLSLSHCRGYEKTHVRSG